MHKILLLVAHLAPLAHEDWRTSRKFENGLYEPRVKKVKDGHGGFIEVDIANTHFDALPVEWQRNNRAYATLTVAAIMQVEKENGTVDSIERAAAVFHEKWIRFNSGSAAEALHVPFADLPEDEKEKDRRIVRRAFEVYERHRGGS